MSVADLCFLSIAEAAQLLGAKELSPLELVEAHLERIGALNETLNSFITLTSDDARRAARASEARFRRGESLGPLDGIPVGLKDLYFTKGVRTTIGSKILADFVPDHDAAVVECLRAGGAAILGKQQMHEFALGATSENPHWGPSRNPWDPSRMTGGSSGGGAAGVAAGLCMAALGTDTGGSLRMPASLCGIVGLKPTFSRVSCYGVFPLSWSLDTAGPLTRSVADAALLMNATAGHDPRDPGSSPQPSEDFGRLLGRDIDGVRIGVPAEWFFDVLAPDVEAAVRTAARRFTELGARVEPISMPIFEHATAIFSPILLAEGATIHLDRLRERAEDFDPDVRTRLEAGALLPATALLRAERARAHYDRTIREAFARVDVLLTPTMPTVAPRFDEPLVEVGGRQEAPLALLPRLTRPFNVCGLPTISVPCGFSAAGLPIGLQLAGRAFEDALVLQVAHAYEQATDWHRQRAPVAY